MELRPRFAAKRPRLPELRAVDGDDRGFAEHRLVEFTNQRVERPAPERALADAGIALAEPQVEAAPEYRAHFSFARCQRVARRASDDLSGKSIVRHRRRRRAAPCAFPAKGPPRARLASLAPRPGARCSPWCRYARSDRAAARRKCRSRC